MEKLSLTAAYTTPADHRHILREQAEELEASFLAEMLSHAGLGDAGDSFSGGAGETQFASFLRQEQARLIAEGGGVGLAELIFSTLVEAEDAART